MDTIGIGPPAAWLFRDTRRGRGRRGRVRVLRRRRETRDGLPALALWLATVADLLGSAALAHLDLLRQDLRFAARSLRRSPGFAVMAILVAGLGIGATTASFSALEHVLVRPLPFLDADRLVKLYQDQTQRGYPRMEVSPPNYRDWKQQSTSFTGMAAYRSLSVNLLGEGYPQRLEGASLTAEVSPLLGRRPLLGRGFSPEDDREGRRGRCCSATASGRRCSAPIRRSWGAG